jgi:uncharacterized membrane protein YgaE (UPF0421/DUF939 family)
MQSSPARAAARARDRLGAGLGELRRAWRVILQATVAAALAYGLAEAIGHEIPFFAPIAAVATVAVSLAHRFRRAFELVLGNALGILFADVLIAQIGTGAWQVGLVVAIALSSALVAGGGPILIIQSSSAAILIATLSPPTPADPWYFERVVDALIGGGVGLAVAAVLMPVDPARHARDATEPILATLRDGYRRVGAALRARDAAAAAAALTDLRDTAAVLTSFQDGLAATRESVRLAPWAWGQRALMASYALAGFHLDNALRNLRVLARQADVALDRHDPVSAAIPDALDALAVAVDGLGAVLAGEPPEPVRRTLLAAVARSSGAAGSAPEPEGPDRGAAAPQPAGAGMFTAPMVAQVRLSASDLLQASGLSATQSAAAIRAAGDAGPDPAP